MFCIYLEVKIIINKTFKNHPKIKNGGLFFTFFKQLIKLLIMFRCRMEELDD